MRFTYSPTADALYVYLREREKSAKMLKIAPGINVDFDAKGRLVGVEVLDASTHAPIKELRRHQRRAGR